MNVSGHITRVHIHTFVFTKDVLFHAWDRILLSLTHIKSDVSVFSAVKVALLLCEVL